MRRISRGLMAKLMGYFMLSSLVPIFIVGFMAYDSGQRAIEKQTTTYLTATANLRADEINRWMSLEEIEVELLAESPGVQRNAARIIGLTKTDPVYKRAYEEMREFFNSSLLADENFREITFLSPNGVAEISTNPAKVGTNHADELYFIRGISGTYTSKIEENSMTISTPVKGGGDSLLGVVVVSFDLRKIRELMEERAGLGETGETYLFDESYRFVASPRARDESILKMEARNPVIEDCVRGGSGAGLYNNYEGRAVIGAYRWLDGKGLCLVAEIEQEEAFSQIFALRNAIFKVGLVVALVIVLSVMVIARSITLPIQQLVDGAEKIGKGDLEHRIRLKSKDEIGVLAKSFNAMVKNLSETQRKLIQSEKLASIGQLAAGVAHELNNPLANISLNAEMLMRKCKDDVSARKLKVISENVDQAARIVRDLLDFSREAQLELEFLDVNEVICKALESLKYEMLDIKVVDNLDPNLPRILGDRVRLKQVFTNIISNALHAMDKGGVLSISTRADKGFIEARVSDTGSGIPKEHLSKIFDPFFTTKGVGKGTGLGLAISYGIVEKHGGVIEVESEVGKGTTFIVKLPRRKNEEDTSS